MKLSFDPILKKYKDTKQLVAKYYPLSIDPKVPWSDICDLKLNTVRDSYNTFNKYSQTDGISYLLGKNIISFEDLLDKMITESEEIYKDAKEIVSTDIYKPYEELEKIDNIITILKNITTKEDFDIIFSSEENYLKIFPYLYRIELSLNDNLFPFIYNYLVLNEVEVFDDIVYGYKYEEVLTQLEIDENEVGNLIENRGILNEVADTVVSTVKKLTSDTDINTEDLLKIIQLKLV